MLTDRLLSYCLVSFILITSACSSENPQKQEGSSDVHEGDTMDAAYGDYSDEQVNYSEISFTSQKDNAYLPYDLVQTIKSGKTNLTKTFKKDGIEFKLTLLPSDYMIANEIKSNTISDIEYDKLLAKYNDAAYFLLQVRTDAAQEYAKFNMTNGQSEYEERIQYISFDMQHDITFRTQDSLFTCDLFHFERSFGINQEDRFLLAANKEIIQGKSLVAIFEERIGLQGKIHFTWTEQDLKNLPTIKRTKDAEQKTESIS